MIATYTLLALAVLALWTGGGDASPALRRFLWVLPFVGSLGAALTAGIVQPLGLVWIGSFAFAAHAFARPRASRNQLLVTAAVILVLAAGLMAHRLPGFQNPRVISALRLSPDAIPYTLYLNYDKTLIGLFVLGWCHARIARLADWRSMLAATAPVAGGLIAVILVLSLAIGYVRPDPKFPAVTWLWLAVNLLFTCVAEEALFRGFIQAQLRRAWKPARWGRPLALVVAAVLFGLAHFAGGAVYVALATVAGLGYGWAYERTQRIEASILTHFALNSAHFLGFTYPALQDVIG
ncbi:MAG TPA: CPBP family intramembrane glutamic endopeptidase [Opitutaceae bacterium]